MILVDHKQGSEGWHKERAESFTASEAAAVFGRSKHTSRNQLIKQKATGEIPEITEFTQRLFDKGHAAEESIRQHVEKIVGEALYPVTGKIEHDGVVYLASFDGLTMGEDTAFEHKLWNEKLAESVEAGVIPDEYKPQLEQQLMVSGANKGIFVVSDGTPEKMVYIWYGCSPTLRLDIIEATKQIKEDVANYKPEAKKEVVLAVEQDDFPALDCKVEGSMVVSNLGEYIPMIRAMASEQISIVLETDQDFADKEAFNKKVKEARANLKSKASEIGDQFTSLADFNVYVKQADEILQKLQSHGEKQVKESKAQKKAAMTFNASFAVMKHVESLNESLGCVYIQKDNTDWQTVIKGKRNLDAMKNALDSEVANQKIEANKQADLIRKNLETIKELSGDCKHLFTDLATLVRKDNDDLTNLIKTRISEHKASEEAQREQIRIEEEAKARKKIADEEAKARISNEEADKAEVDKKAQHDVKAAEPEIMPEAKAKPKKLVYRTPKKPELVTHIDAELSEKGDGYNLYLGDRKVGVIDSSVNLDISVNITFKAA